MDAACPKCTAQSFDAALELQLLLHHLDSDLLAAGILQEAFVSLEDAFVVGICDAHLPANSGWLCFASAEKVLRDGVRGAAQGTGDPLDAQHTGMQMPHELFLHRSHMGKASTAHCLGC